MQRERLFSSEYTLGILGGGQLGKMILTDTRRYDIRTKILDPSESAPCRIGSNEFIVGDLKNEQEVVQFGQNCDTITIEIENVSIPALHQLEHQGINVFPKPATLSIIQSKRLQKRFYKDQDVPTAEFFEFDNLSELKEILEQGKMQFPMVWKAASGGYDGRGVQILYSLDEVATLPDTEGIVEHKEEFVNEISVVTARSASGEIKSFPVVEMDFHPVANQVEFVFSPSTLSEAVQKKAIALAEDLVKKLDHVGLLAVEMFYMGGTEILVNEVAPRVHNSGHLSIEGNVTSQFDQHLRAILDLPLGDTTAVRPAVMINLVGEEGYNGPVVYQGINEVMSIPGVAVHLYGKAETRPFRKMGHITITDTDLESARIKARKVKETIKVISK